MRVAYVVDVHDRPEAVVEVVRDLGPVDVLVVGGDITTGGTPDEAEAAIELWRPLASSLLAVSGNMDSPEIDRRLDELGVSIAGRGVVVDGVGIGGVSAAPHSPLHTRYEVPDRALAEAAVAALADLAGARVRILCPHAPPFGACDRLRSGEHVGSRSLRDLIEREAPDVVLCGHIHEARGVETVAGTQVVNPGPAFAGNAAVVDVGERVAVTLVPI